MPTLHSTSSATCGRNCIEERSSRHGSCPVRSLFSGLCTAVPQRVSVSGIPVGKAAHPQTHCLHCRRVHHPAVHRLRRALHRVRAEQQFSSARHRAGLLLAAALAGNAGSDRKPDRLFIFHLCRDDGGVFPAVDGTQRPCRDLQPTDGLPCLHGAAAAGPCCGTHRAVLVHRRAMEPVAAAGIQRRSLLAVRMAAARPLCRFSGVLYAAEPRRGAGRAAEDHLGAGGIHLSVRHLSAAVRDVPRCPGVRPQRPAGPGKPAAGYGIPPVYGVADLSGQHPPSAARLPTAPACDRRTDRDRAAGGAEKLSAPV